MAVSCCRRQTIALSNIGAASMWYQIIGWVSGSHQVVGVMMFEVSIVGMILAIVLLYFASKALLYNFGQ